MPTPRTIHSSAIVHESAYIEDGVVIEEGVRIWHNCHVRKGAILRRGVSLAKDVYVDADVEVGEGSRIQNGVSLYKGVHIDPWCFVGPHVIFTNDRFPRAGNKNWKIVPTHLSVGASVGAGAIIRCGVTLGAFSMIAAGAIVTKSIEDFHLALGIPAHPVRRLCVCGQKQIELELEFSSPIQGCCLENMDPEPLRWARSVVANENLK